jgi:autotransporter-associated beta strand protein
MTRSLPARILVALLALLAAETVAGAATNLSAWAFPGTSGRILRQPDALGNRVLDYANVGYRSGTAPIPDVPVKVTIAPVAGDDGTSIQAAINAVKALPLDSNGFRGAVLLSAGEYQISNSITINASGVVLRGVGDGTDGTILRATGTGQRTLVNVTGSGSPSTVAGTTHNLTDTYVPVGACSFNVDSTSGLAVGDRVFVRRNCNSNWIATMGMDLLCCEPDVHIWSPADYVMDSDRVITRIEGSRVTVDAPITCAIEQRWGGGTIRKYTWSGRITSVGVEHLRGVSDYVAADDEDHGWVFVAFSEVEHGWARRVTSQYFGYSCVALYTGSKWVTVTDCQALDPISIITGGRRYAFVMDDAQLCLIANCYNRKDRHLFVTESLTIGPNVFVDGLSDTAYADAGPHHRWGTGALWDAVTINGNSLNVQNRGNSGSGHGWAGGNEVVWNCDADGGFVVQNPPTARNWLIGSLGAIENGTMYVGPHAAGTYDSHGTNVFPSSLYYAQLQDRLAAARLETREYWLGDLDLLTSTSPTGEVVAVDATWRSAVQAAAGSAPLRGFDLAATNQWVPFTFNFTLAANERIVAASLALALRGASTAATNEVLFLDDLTNSFSLATLGWQPLATGTNSTVRVLDLQAQLARLADGRLNLALRDDAGVDWALLELHVAPRLTVFTNALLPAADATVRGGTSAVLNFGTNATLDVKLDSNADVLRRAYLRWDLSDIAGEVLEARVRLTPASVGTNGLELGATLATTNAWSETAITWNNQPGDGKRFATWIPSADGPVEFTVTPQVQAALDGPRALSLQVFSLKDVGAPGLVSYAAREAVDVATRPQLLLVMSNAAPVISSFADLALPARTSSGPLAFTIGDAQTPPAQLALAASATDTNLVPPAGFMFAGSQSNRTLTVTPAPGQAGSTLVSVRVTDAGGLSARASFTLTVTNTVLPVASGAWLFDASGAWGTAANWTNGLIANGTHATATFAVDVTADRFINHDTPQTLGHFNFTDANTASPGQWFITNQHFTMQVSSGAPVFTVAGTTATIAATLAGTQGLTKQGDGTLALAAANTFSGGATISAGGLRVVNGSALGSTGNGTSIGNAATARLELAGDITLAEPITMSCKGSALGNVPAVVNHAGTNTLAGPLTHTTGGSYWTYEAAGGKLIVSGHVTNSTTTNVRTIWLRGTAEGDWRSAIGNSAAGLATNLRKDDSGAWTLSGTNSTAGSVALADGTLFINGVLASGSSVDATGGTLGGTGRILCPVTIRSGATLAPGVGLGTLTLSNTLSLLAGSMTAMKLNAATLVCDSVVGLSSVSFGGTLSLTNLAGTFATGQSFQLFRATSATGNFAAITPSSPGPGLAWDFSPATGTLTVVAVAPPQFTQAGFGTNGAFALTGTGPSGQGYRIFAGTNVLLPVSAWLPVSTGVFAGGAFSFSEAPSESDPARFYRVVTP